MARMNKMSVQKRLRERKKAEKAQIKREMRAMREPAEESGDGSPTRDDLVGYGMVVEEEEEETEEG